MKWSRTVLELFINCPLQAKALHLSNTCQVWSKLNENRKWGEIKTRGNKSCFYWILYNNDSKIYFTIYSSNFKVLYDKALWFAKTCPETDVINAVHLSPDTCYGCVVIDTTINMQIYSIVNCQGHLKVKYLTYHMFFISETPSMSTYQHQVQ